MIHLLIQRELKTSSHVPTRSGPTIQRQSAQKTVTVNPTVTTVSSVKSKKDQGSESTTLIGVQTADPADIITRSEVTENRPVLGVTDAIFGIPDSILPDLGSSREVTITDVLNQTQEAHSTEEELDAADTLLSLSNVRDTPNPTLGIDDIDNIDDNALLMPIGGESTIEDVAPEPLCLEQVEVDEGIARMLTMEEHEKLSSLSGVPTDGKPANKLDSSTEKTTLPARLPGVQNVSNDSPQMTLQHDTDNQQTGDQTTTEDISKGAQPKTQAEKTTDVVTKKGSCGAFKSQLYGLR